jgi:hypothetical protein
VTFHYLGRDWFLCGKSWTDEFPRASHYVSEEAAGAALAKARRYMRNKQAKARIVAITQDVDLRRSADASNRNPSPQYVN